MTFSGRRRAWRRACAAALLVVAAPLSACGDDDPAPQGQDPSATPTSATSDPTSPSSSEATSDPSSDPTVAPAAGLLLELDATTVNAPEGWTQGAPSSFYVTAQDPASLVSSVFMANGPDTAGGDLDRMARAAIESSTAATPPKRQPDTVLGGEPAYFLSGRTDSSTMVYEYGAARGGTEAQLIVSLDADLPRAQQQALVDQVLASFTWR